MKHIGLFEGIGGFSLAASWMGWNTIAWCEINPFCQKVLKYHFPKATPHEDIKTTDFSIYRGQCDVLTGGFPCQPFSVSGKKRGSNDERYLYPEMLRAIHEIKPTWVVPENVRGITSKKFEPIYNEIYTSLEAAGYEIVPLLIPASAIGANHERYRIWFVAYSNINGMERYRIGGNIKQDRQRWQGSQAAMFNQKKFTEGYSAESESELIRADDGLPDWMDRVKALGNAIVPGLAYEIFKAIEMTEQVMIEEQNDRTERRKSAK